jgi:hypothetical protein
MKIADSIWLATALLHRENAEASDFSVQEIIDLGCRYTPPNTALPINRRIRAVIASWWRLQEAADDYSRLAIHFIRIDRRERSALTGPIYQLSIKLLWIGTIKLTPIKLTQAPPVMQRQYQFLINSRQRQKRTIPIP